MLLLRHRLPIVCFQYIHLQFISYICCWFVLFHHISMHCAKMSTLRMEKATNEKQKQKKIKLNRIKMRDAIKYDTHEQNKTQQRYIII